jgi:hypothetical protein
MMAKEMASDLYGMCPDEIEDGDVFLAEVKIDHNKNLRKITLRKVEGGLVNH